MHNEQSPDLSIFGEAVEFATPLERAAYLDRACRDNPTLRANVEVLLQAHFEAGKFLQSGPSLSTTLSIRSPATEPLGTAIGPYKLREVLGEGGMGIVYAAEQEQPIRRKVALKVIKPGMDSKEIIGRFSAERQALALMDHPNIAKVLDAGTTESGPPYFVMELVRGLPITEYCDQAKLSLRERLKLFITVCQAVQHAHQKGIIHRDLKPSNVMITLHDGTPVPKVIDFGVAKALNQRLTEQTVYTKVHSLVGTPVYMSPEQAELSGLDVDTRSDVYALGTLLYELLTGHTPFDKEALSKVGYDEMRRIIREDEPPRPSQRVNTLTAADSTTVSAQRGIDARRLQSSLRGELDWIVMKSLEKDRDRRYESASAFAADVERYLDNEPVEACPPSAGYRLRKFVRRNSVALVTTGLVAVALVVGTGVSVWQAVRADFQGRQARTNLRKAREAVDQMLLRVSGQLASIPKMEPVRRELLSDALKFYEAFLAGDSTDPEIRHERSLVYIEYGKVQGMLGEFDAAEESYLSAIGILKELLASSRNNPEYREALAHAYNVYGILLNEDSDRFDDSEQALEQGLAISRELVAEFPSRFRGPLANQLNSMGCLLWKRGRLVEAERSHREALALSQELPNADESEELSASLFNLAHMLDNQGRVAEAEAMYRQELAVVRKIAEKDPHDPNKWLRLSDSQSNFAGCLNKDGTRAESEQLLRDCTAIRKCLAESFPNVPAYRYSLSVAHLNLGTIVADSGRFAEAEQSYRASLPIAEQLAAEFPNVPTYREMVAHAHNNLGDVALQQDRTDDAVRAFLKAMVTFNVLAQQIPDQPNLRSLQCKATIGWGLSMLEREKAAAAQSNIRRGLAIAEELVANFSDSSDYRVDLGDAYGAMGIVEYRLGNWSEAARWFEKTNEIASGKADADMLFYVAMTHWQLGEKDEASKVYHTAIEWMQTKGYTTPRLLRLRTETEQLTGLVKNREEPADALSALSSALPE